MFSSGSFLGFLHYHVHKGSELNFFRVYALSDSHNNYFFFFKSDLLLN
jgi:hypothetical protein